MASTGPAPVGTTTTKGSNAAMTLLTGVLFQHCADVGGDPDEMVLSTHVRFGADSNETAATAAAFADAGADLAIVILPVPYSAGVLGPLAEALSELT